MTGKKILYLRLLVVVAFLSVIFCSKKPTGETPALSEGRVVLIKGEVRRNDVPVTPEESIKDGDHIITGKDSAVEIVFGGGLIARLGGESDARINLKKGVFTMERGWFAAVKNADAKGIEVVTPTATASVRGTSLCMKVESPESTYACSCNGTVHFHTKDGTVLPLTAAHHSARTFTSDGKIAEAGLKYHDDAGIEEMAKKIHHPLDWNRPSE